MNFRKSKEEDIENIMIIIKKAQDYLKEEDINQWQNGYPNEESIQSDIDKGESYVLVDDGNIIGTTALSFDGETTYDTIYEGEWLTENDYAVIHRIAVDMDFRGKGLAGIILKRIEELCIEKGFFDIKIDTHRQNLSMKKFIEKNHFKYCGIIYLSDGNERIAFEKVLKK